MDRQRGDVVRVRVGAGQGPLGAEGGPALAGRRYELSGILRNQVAGQYS